MLNGPAKFDDSYKKSLTGMDWQSYFGLFQDSQYQIYRLGYELDYNEERDHVVLTLPDKEALLANWRKVQELISTLPDLKIISISGKSSDEDFIKTFIENTFVLSEGSEFVHDHTNHIYRYALKTLFDYFQNPRVSQRNTTFSERNDPEITINDALAVAREKVRDIYSKIVSAKNLLPDNEKSKFDPLLNILSQNIDLVLSFNNDAKTTRDINYPAIFSRTLDELNKNLQIKMTIEDIHDLCKEAGIVLYFNKKRS